MDRRRQLLQTPLTFHLASWTIYITMCTVRGNTGMAKLGQKSGRSIFHIIWKGPTRLQSKLISSDILQLCMTPTLLLPKLRSWLHFYTLLAIRWHECCTICTFIKILRLKRLSKRGWRCRGLRHSQFAALQMCHNNEMGKLCEFSAVYPNFA